jgi:Ribonuclease G/E
VCHEVFRELERYSLDPDIKKILVYLNPNVVDYVYQNEKSLVRLMEQKFKKAIVFESDNELHHEQYEISLQE